MTSENDAEFVALMMEQGDWGPGSRMHRLALLARRGAAAADRIEQLEAALRPLACTCEARNQADCSRSEFDCPFWNARAALKGRP
jgi:hypothetical protein